MRHKTNWQKKLADPSEYKSNWDWTVAHSEYHFDINKEDKVGDWFDILGTFDNPELWKAERDAIVKEAYPINWETRKYYGDNDEVSPMLEQEEYDIAQGGTNPKELMLTNLYDKLEYEPEKFPVLTKMANYFGLDLGYGSATKKRIHAQMPGQMFNLHIDKLWDRDPIDPERVARITIFLEDWKPGQFYMYGNYVYSHWKAGEAHIFDWPNVPHATANASNDIRVSLQLTGFKTERTRRLINNASVDNVFKI